jgi:hypothetical protein
MPMGLRSFIHRVIACSIVVLVVGVPLQALADEASIPASAESATPIADVVDQVVEPASDAAGTVVDVVEPPAEVVDGVEEIVGGAVADVGDTTQAVVDEAPTVSEAGEAAGNASGTVQGGAAAAVNHVAHVGGSGAGSIAGGQSDGGAASAAAPAGSNKPSERNQRPHREQPDAERSTIASAGSEWRRMHFFRLGVVVPASSFLYQPVALHSDPADESEKDPCEKDPGLACLGLLFGIGEFADGAGGVLGLFLAATGVALRGLIVLAFALLLAGVVALSVAPKRATSGGTG